MLYHDHLILLIFPVTLHRRYQLYNKAVKARLQTLSRTPKDIRARSALYQWRVSHGRQKTGDTGPLDLVHAKG